MQYKNMKKKLLITLILIALIALGAFLVLGTKKNSITPSNSGEPREVNSVDYGGPTELEKQAGDSQKENNVDRDTIDKGPRPSTAEIIIVDSSQYDSTFEIRSYISNIFEDGGSCTVTLTKANNPTISRTGPATSSATNTQCPKTNIPVSEFTSKGEWQLVITYSSASATGSTPQKAINIK